MVVVTQWKGNLNKIKKSNIYDACHGGPLRRHIMKVRQYDEATYTSIDWAAIGHAGKSMTTADQTWLTKHVGCYNPTA